MSYQTPTQAEMKKILSTATRIAIVGLSDKPNRASYRVASYLQQAGYEIIPVNPHIDQVLGIEAYPSLSEVKEVIDVVNVFRRPEVAAKIAEEAVSIGAKVLWLQIGVGSEEAYSIAHHAGLDVVMDKCMMVEHSQIFS